MSSKSKVPQIRFGEFNGEWEEKTLDDVIDDLYNGQTPSRIINSYWNGTINWLSSGELNRSIVKRTIEKISINGQKSANLRLVPSGTFVMAITGLEAVGTRGNCAILGIDTTLNQSCMAIYPKKDLLNTSFLFHWYRKNSEEYGIKFTQGTKQQSYNASIIRKLDILLPKINEQTKIGDYFQKLDKLIEQKEKKYQKLRQFKKAMLSKMFPKNGADTPEIRFKGFSGKWIKRKFIDNISSIQTGTNLLGSTNNKGIPLLKMGNIQRGYFSFEKVEYLNENIEVEAENIAHYGDFLFNTRNTLELVGKGATWMGKSGEFAFNSNLARFTFDGINTIFFNYLYNTQSIISQVQARAMGTTSVAAIYPKNLNSIEYYLPDLEEQTKIGNYFQKLDKQIELQLQELEKLKNIKKASLSKMFV